MNTRKIFLTTITAITLILGSHHALWAQFSQKEGWFLSVGVSWQSLGGDFNGETILVGPQDVFLVPSIRQAVGIGGKIGYRVEMAALELSYYRGNHNVSWVGATGEAVFNLWSLNFQYYFLEDSPLQPFLQLGWSPVTALRVRDGAVLATTMEVSDAIFISELGNFNAGAGAVYYLNPKVFVQLAVLFYKLGYGSVESEAEKVALKIDQNIDANEIHLQFGVAYTF